jgi:hypothetical protein
VTTVRGRVLSLPDRQPLVQRLAGVGSMRAELEALLAASPTDASPALYRELVLDRNVTGKRSASTRLWAWKRLTIRCLLDPAVPECEAFLAGMRGTASAPERGLLCALMFARTDRLFREVTLECVSPYLAQESTLIDPVTVRASAPSRRWSYTTA